MNLVLNITTELPEGIDGPLLEHALKVTQDELGGDYQGQVNLALVDEATSRQLNQQFAGNDYSTDVLSFDYFEDEQRQPTASDERAEIIICLPIAAAQAKEHSLKLVDELLMLFVHGVLHVLGHDHHESTEQASFAAHQNAIMLKLTDSYRDIFAW